MSARDGRAEKVRKHFLPFIGGSLPRDHRKFTLISWETLGAVLQKSAKPAGVGRMTFQKSDKSIYARDRVIRFL